MRTKLLFATGLLALQVFALPALNSIAYAQTATCAGSDKGAECPWEVSKDAGPDIIVNLIDKVANWMFTILLVLAVIFIVWAAYNYLLSEGNEEKVTAAHKALVYAAVAVAVAVLARGFVYVVRNTVMGTNVAQQYQSAPTNNNGNTNTNNGNNNGNGQLQPSNIFSYVTTFTEFRVRVQTCSDDKTPGVIIVNEDDTTQRWSNLGEDGNPLIVFDSGAGGVGPNNQENAGQWVPVGTINTAILGLGALGLGTDYSIKAQTCNDGQVPKVQYNKSNTNNNLWQALN